jgi:hypothetical protein
MMKREKNTTPEIDRVQMVYCGARMDSQHKKYFAYYSLGTNKQGGYDKKLLGYENIGAIIEVTKTDTGVKGPYKPVGRLEKDSDIYTELTGWTIEDRAAKETYATILLLKKGCEDDTLDSLIKQIASSCSSLNLKERMRVARYVFEKIIG